MAKVVLFLGVFWSQALPTQWAAEIFRTQAEALHFQGAQSWARQHDLLYMQRVPMPFPTAAPSPLVPLWEKYALFDLLRESAPYELEKLALAEAPSYRSALARFYAAKYAFLRKNYTETLEHLAGLNPKEFPPALRQEMQFIEGYAAYATGDRERALQRLRPLAEKVGPFHDAANYYLGLIFYERGDWRGAAAHLQAVQARAPYAQEAPLWLAYALGQIPDFPQLISWAERWAVQDPPPAHAETLWTYIATTLAQARQCAAAEKFAAPVKDHPLVRLHLGICAYQEKKDSAALRFWEPLLGGKDSISLWARYGYASSLVRLGRKEEALGLLSAIPPSSTPPAPAALWLTAQIAWDLRLVESGKNALLAYLQLPNPPKRVEALRYLAEFYALEGKYELALRTLDTLPSAVVGEPRQRLRLAAGLRAFAEKQYSTAESLFAQASKVEGPHTPTALFWRAEALYRQGDLRRAIEAYQQFLHHPRSKESPHYDEARLAVAWSYLQQNQADEALRYSESLRREHKRSIYPFAAFVAAGAYYLKKRYADALTIYRELLNSPLPQGYVRYHLAQTLVRLERYKEAEETLEGVPLSSPGADAALHLKVEICALWLHRPSCTKAAAETFLHHFPHSPKAAVVLARLGLAQIELGEKQAAAHTLRRVLREYTASPEAVKLSLEGLRTILSPEEYDETYEEFLRRLPPESETRLSFERDRLRQLAEAERWAVLDREAASIAERYPALAGEALAWQAKAAEHVKDTLRALEYYHRLTSYSEYRPTAWERLALLYSERGEFSQALAAQDSFLRYMPTTGYPRIQALLTWANLAARFGKADSAQKVLLSLLADTLLSNFSRQKLLLGIALLSEKAGQVSSALSYLEKVVAIEKNGLAAEALYHQARLLYGEKRYDEARSAIYRLRDELPQYLEMRARAYLFLARIFIDENKRKSAQRLLESLIENAPSDDIRKEAQALKDSIPPEPPPPPKPPKKKK
ncbi:MAG: tetratricopeptide repeat protein [Bacteroidia bacterium]|nr:tetratricopeptide repeat protein [Bacteroidia bacterium]MCX7764418.1 tetratricopeptide repeat protein [Bacteroidia bacterium]MDW8056705.1 tetratricopeptide repeat protein [Bacteroidia bacterium]